MQISTRSIVSNSDIIKNYKSCREKADRYDKVYILKNNQPDAVLFSFPRYKRLSVFIEYLENLEDINIEAFVTSLPKQGKRKTYSIDCLRNDIKNNMSPELKPENHIIGFINQSSK